MGSDGMAAFEGSLLEALPDPMFVLDDAGRITLASSLAAKLLCVASASELVGRAYRDFLAPEDRDRAQVSLDEALAGYAVRALPLTALAVGGRRIPVEVSAGLHAAGAGARRSVVVVARDLSERTKLEEQLRQALKMEAVGRLAGGVAHDFNNLIGAILGYADLVASQLPASSPLAADVHQIQLVAERGGALTRQLLAFSRRQVLQPRVLDLGAVVADVRKLLGRLIGEDVRLQVKTPPAPLLVRADQGQLEQVLMNLALNARDAMPGGGVLTLEVAGADEWAVLTVSDTGLGMPPEVREHLFEPFFTTKVAGRGTGLGLATVYGIVVQSGGRVDVTSEVGQGSTFTVRLPRVVDGQAEALQAAEAPRDVRGTETVLVVEDDEALLTMVTRILERYGWNVLPARNPGEALLVCESRREPIDLLLTDVIMPVLDGVRLAERLAPLHPEMRLLYMSGYLGDARASGGGPPPGGAFLAKPFTAAALTAKVREVLDAPARRP